MALLQIHNLEMQEANRFPFTTYPSYLAVTSFGAMDSACSFMVASYAITMAFVIGFECLLLSLHYSFRPFQKLFVYLNI
jgi:hypothetical protein